MRLEAAADKIIDRSAEARFRLAIDRVFTLPGVGVVVTGTVLSGSVDVEDHVLVSPSGLPARVRSLHAQNKAADTGRAGDRCALNLVGDGISKEGIHRGDMVLDPDLHAPTDRIDATLTSCCRARPKPVRQWLPARLHHASSEVGAHIVPCWVTNLFNRARQISRCSTRARPADRGNDLRSLRDPRRVGPAHHRRRQVHRLAATGPETAHARTPGAARRSRARRPAVRLSSPAGDTALCMGFWSFRARSRFTCD